MDDIQEQLDRAETALSRYEHGRRTEKRFPRRRELIGSLP